MTRKIKVTAIVPTYNEGRRIVGVVAALRGAKNVSEIIVVDDGSTAASREILTTLPVTLVTHKKNKGKAQAVLTGLLRTRTEAVLLIDADLTGITPLLIDRMIEEYWTGKYDLLLGDREREFALWRKLGMALAFTGERVCSKQLLLALPDLFGSQGYLAGYLLEVKMNKYFFNKLHIGRFVLQGVGQTYKLRKGGINALLADARMHLAYLNFLGWRSYLAQCGFVRRLP